VIVEGEAKRVEMRREEVGW
jgi:hypothetical protein